MKPIYVGTFRLGLRFYKLYGHPETANGSVELLPDSKSTSEIHIGFDAPWGEVFGVLLHEIYEAQLVEMNLRYKPKPAWSEESSDYIFFVSHNQLGEIHERIGPFMTDALPAFTSAYRKFQIQKKKIDKKKKK